MYPLCVGAERVLQAQTIAQMALSLNTTMVAHGCTAAGNDQVRFEVALRTLAPDLEIIAPVRDRAFKRPEQLQVSRGSPACPSRRIGAAYSVNRGLWGVTIGGKETLTSAASIPENAWVLSKDAFSNPRAPERHTIGFEAGIPGVSTARRCRRLRIIERLEALAGPFGIGRGIHLGDTVIGTKGRVAFEAPAADVLLTAHRELEKLVLTGKQARIKESVAQPYGDLVHEGQHLDPVCRDIEALLVSSQARVTGEVAVLFRPGSVFVEGVTSPYSLMAASKGVYGEAAGEWTPTDALGYSKMLALDRDLLQARRRRTRPCARSVLPPANAAKGTSNHERHAHGRRRQDRIGDPGVGPHARDSHRRGHSLRGRRGGGGRDPEQQVHLQHARADQRPHGQSGARRCRGRRARTPQSLVRLFGTHPRSRSCPAM